MKILFAKYIIKTAIKCPHMRQSKRATVDKLFGDSSKKNCSKTTESKSRKTEHKNDRPEHKN